MSSFTMEQYNALIGAIAEGALRVKYQDKEVEYRSLTEMLKLKSLMENDLGLGGDGTDNPSGGRRLVGTYGSGLC